jgi:hypothetical protein
MSWSVSAIGKPAAVAAKVQKDLSAYKCVEPEEQVKVAAGAAIVAAVTAYPPDSCVKVSASGHQGTATEEGKAFNNLRVDIEPVYGFVE